MRKFFLPNTKKCVEKTVVVLFGFLCLTVWETAVNKSVEQSPHSGFANHACADAFASKVATKPAPVYTYKVVRSYPHDPHAFTQGLLFEKGYFYESTGLYGGSSLRKVEVSTGATVKLYELPKGFFGEGLTLFEDRLIQLTWRSGVAFVYDKERFIPLRHLTYSTEGWGLTHDGEQFVMSDGSATLFFRDSETFAETGTIEVRDDRGPLSGLNELEYVRGEILANVLPTDRIARIDPRSGQVTGWIDLNGLLSVELRDPAMQVPNGIAYDAEHDRLFVTGKLWPKIFEIQAVPVH